MFPEYNDDNNLHDKLDKMLLYQKGMEILDLMLSIAYLIGDENKQLARIPNVIKSII